MKHLLLVRHAKSSWDHPNLVDHDRPLSKRGLRDAPNMAIRIDAAIKKANLTLDMIHTSTALRAVSFAQHIAQACDVPLIEHTELYTFSATSLLRSLSQMSETSQMAAVVGHNPAMTTVAETLTAQNFDNIPTAGFVLLRCDISSWAEILTKTHTCLLFDYPKKERKDHE